MINSLEMIKAVSSLLTPVAVVVLGFFINSRLKSIDQRQWQSRKLVEKRIEFYDMVAADLNLLYCFCRWVGYWKDITPPEMIEAKRRLDKAININRYAISESFYLSYNDFVHTVFQTYSGRGLDALIRSEISGPEGDRRNDASHDWDQSWDELFNETAVPDFQELDTNYRRVMESIKRDIGLNSA